MSVEIVLHPVSMEYLILTIGILLTKQVTRNGEPSLLTLCVRQYLLLLDINPKSMQISPNYQLYSQQPLTDLTLFIPYPAA
jgi:hypothetical protein